MSISPSSVFLIAFCCILWLFTTSLCYTWSSIFRLFPALEQSLLLQLIYFRNLNHCLSLMTVLYSRLCDQTLLLVFVFFSEYWNNTLLFMVLSGCGIRVYHLSTKIASCHSWLSFVSGSGIRVCHLSTRISHCHSWLSFVSGFGIRVCHLSTPQLDRPNFWLQAERYTYHDVCCHRLLDIISLTHQQAHMHVLLL